MFVYTTSVEGKELSSLDFFLKKMGLISKISRKKGKVSDQGHIFLGMISANFPPKWLETASDFFSGGYKLGSTKSVPCPPE